MLQYSLLDIPLHKKFLIDLAHFIYDPCNIQRGGEDNQSSDVFAWFASQKVPHQEVSSKASPHHIDFRAWKSFLNFTQSLFQLCMGHPRERDRAGHLAIDSSAVKANTVVALLRSRFHKFLDVIHLTASCQSMHNEEYRRILGLDLRGNPVKRNMSAVIKKDLFPVKGVWKKRLTDVIDRLKKRVHQIRSWLVQNLYLFWLGFHFKKAFVWSEELGYLFEIHVIIILITKNILPQLFRLHICVAYRQK